MNTVKLSDNHLKVINKALETYYRLKSGQIKIAIDTAYDYVLDWNESEKIESYVRSLIPKFKSLNKNASYSFNSVEIGDAKIAYEIKKIFEEFLAVKQNDGYYGNTVDFNGPLKASDEPFPIILGHKIYKDYPLNRTQSEIIINLDKERNYLQMWDYINSLKLNLPKGEKREVILDKFTGDEAIYGGSNTRVLIRVYKPRKD